MDENEKPEDEKHPTQSGATEPQEEFIEPKARPSRPEQQEEKSPAPPKEED